MERFEANKVISTPLSSTGGEPVLQPEAIIEASKLWKRHGFKVMLDTNWQREGED
jgi:pyruvate-formate lyase-activating enzyme